MTTVTDFEVQRLDLRRTRLADRELECGPGQALCRIDKFALTANNITYAVFGEAMHYWNFFPSNSVWGRTPVWGYAEVVESRHEAIAVGERLYGYWPMSSHVTLQPDRVTATQFLDGAAHRRPLPTPYQVYMRLARDPLHDPKHEDHRALLHPLFFTSWLIEDFLADNALFGAKQVVLASASSKTALGVAFLLRIRGQTANSPGVLGQGTNSGGISSLTPNLVGLTSPRNKAFCEKLGYYDQVVTYDALGAMKADVPTVFVDMAGDGKLLKFVHHHFREQLTYSCIVGATHWEQRQTQHDLPGARPQFFFAPSQAQKRQKDWGPEEFFTRFGQAWRAFLPSVEGWLQVKPGFGPAAIKLAWHDMLEGRTAPEIGLILSP